MPEPRPQRAAKLEAQHRIAQLGKEKDPLEKEETADPNAHNLFPSNFNQSTDPNKENGQGKLNAQAKHAAPKKAQPLAAPAPVNVNPPAKPVPVYQDPKVEEPAEDGPDKFPVPKRVSASLGGGVSLAWTVPSFRPKLTASLLFTGVRRWITSIHPGAEAGQGRVRPGLAREASPCEEERQRP